MIVESFCELVDSNREFITSGLIVRTGGSQRNIGSPLDAKYSIIITNITALVQTGQMKLPIPILAGAGVLLFVAGWRMVFVKEKKNA